MRHTPNTSAPTCPGCGARHYPATTGAGSRVWCGGRLADPAHERARLRAEHERDSFRREHAERASASTPEIEAWEIHAPDSLPSEI